MKNKKVLIGLISLIALAFVFLLVYKLNVKPAQSGEKSVKVIVVHGDGSSKEFTYQTSAEYLGTLLKDEKLVEGYDGDYGLYITSADGEQANESKKQWWCITKNNEMVNTSADQTPLTDGDQYELTLSTY